MTSRPNKTYSYARRLSELIMQWFIATGKLLGLLIAPFYLVFYWLPNDLWRELKKYGFIRTILWLLSLFLLWAFTGVAAYAAFSIIIFVLELGA